MASGKDVTFPMLLTLGIVALNGDTLAKLKTKTTAKIEAGTGKAAETPPIEGASQFLIGWGIVYMTLLILAESSESTAPLAVAFAWLIPVSTLFAVGPKWFNDLSAKAQKGSLF